MELLWCLLGQGILSTSPTYFPGNDTNLQNNICERWNYESACHW